MNHIDAKKLVSYLDTYLNTHAGYEFSRDVFSRIMRTRPTKFNQHHTVLKASLIDTLLGPMIAIADNEGLYLLEFVDKRGLERTVARLMLRIQAEVAPGVTEPIKSIMVELTSYFEGTLTEFKTPIHLVGTPFQRTVWEELMRIPHGQTRTYATQSEAIGKAAAYRAVANANGANQLAILIPCHRIIKSNGDLGGYAGGITRKQLLIDHEKQKSGKNVERCEFIKINNPF